MLLKKIYLRNIRSYEDAEIDLPSGSILLSGDIGAGKTSVLLAIEFALFGLEKGNLTGSSLLRTDRNSGSVRLEMEIANKDVVIERVLKRSKRSVTQEAGCISINNEREELSPTQLKQKILELLDYPPDYLTKTNLLYRYTIYTPQESMREIMLEKADLRLDTLRRIFGIDKYKAVSQNLSIFSSKLRESIKGREGMVIDIDSKKTELTRREIELAKSKSDFEDAKKRLELLQKSVKDKKLAHAESEKRIQQLNELKTEIAAKKSELSAFQEQSRSTAIEQKNLGGQIQALQEEAKHFKFKDTEKELAAADKLISETDKQRVQLEKDIAALSHEKRQHEEVKISISEIDVCPLCRQGVPHQHKLGILAKANSEIERLDRQIKDKLIQKELAEKNLAKLEKHFEELQETAKEQILLRTKLSRIEEKQNELKKMIQSGEKLNEKISVSQESLQKLAEKLKDFSNLQEEYDKSRQEIEGAQEQERDAAIVKAQIEKSIENCLEVISSLRQEIKEKEKIKSELEHLNKLRKWIQDRFPIVLSKIEQAVMAKLHADFSALFEKWFSMLVSELSVRLDENFTPIMESRGYELDYSFLSGGERTAVALAYRLALNQVINSFISKIMTRDILILDEPTDGFSSEQLDRMRDVLAELKAKQLILVSHEAKMESFVENIIRFSKKDGRTSVHE